jgi:serine O-acetyltransferase
MADANFGNSDNIDQGLIDRNSAFVENPWRDLLADFRRFASANSHRKGLVGLLANCLEYGFIAIAIYRYGRWCRMIRPRWLSIPPKLIYQLLRVFSNLILGIELSTASRIGPSFYIGHWGGIVVGADCEIGSGCSIGQGVTIGYKGAGKSTRGPVIGNNVYVGVSAVVVGEIRVGHGVIVGANTTVVKDVPDNYRVVSAAVRMEPIAVKPS